MEGDETEKPVSAREDGDGEGNPRSIREYLSGDPSNRLTRRSVLGGLAAIGATGAVSGAGARALLYDEEVFGNADGDGDVNVLQSGELDLKHCWEVPGEDCTPNADETGFDFGDIEKGDRGSATLRCAIVDNPGWMWFRTSCPQDPCGFEDVVEVTMWIERDCDGKPDDYEEVLTVGGTAIENLPFCEALSLLHEGVLLDGHIDSDELEPHTPDETCCLGIEWEVVDHICPEDDLEQAITFEFYTEQARHTDGPPANPWPAAECDVDCDTECEPCVEDAQSISHVAFCTDEGTISSGDISFVPHYDLEGEPYRIEWEWTGEGTSPLCTIALFYGSNEGQFYENFNVEGADDGTVTTGEGTKYCWKATPEDGNCDSFPSAEENGQSPPDPCPDDCGCGVKFEFEDGGGVWEEVC